MNLLIEKGLMFGNLVRVDNPAWVERYNRALKKRMGKTTALTEFHVDISGYSPEIGDELGDHLYLNPNGVNRSFILLTTAQKHAPLLNAKFSTSRGILRQFIDENESQLFALTARDAVAGELVNTVFAADTPADLFKIGPITVKADTVEGTLASTEALEASVERFKTEPEGWWDQALISEIIDLARKTGDVTRTELTLKFSTFTQQNYWTSLFDGIYIFRNADHPAAISVRPREGLGPLPIAYVTDFFHHDGIAQFLQLNRLAQPIVTQRGAQTVRILREKMEMIVVDVAAEAGEDVSHATSADLTRYAQRHVRALPDEWHALAALVRWAEGSSEWPRISSSHPAYFYTLRATPSEDADLVNRLLADLTPYDFRQLFICHKEAFYSAYQRWPEAKKTYVANYLERAYLTDKASLRDHLFEQAEEQPAPRARRRKGPWG